MKNTRNTFISGLLGLGVGAGVMYFSDPQRGAKRRHRVAEKGVRATHRGEDILEKASRDAVNRGRGVLAGVRSRVGRRSEPDDEILVSRVRAALGRYVSHPHAIEVHSDGGLVTLQGHILAGELAALIDRIERVPGIREVRNRLKVHERSERNPMLQGGAPPRGQHADLFQENWAPSTRVFMGSGSLGMVIYGLLRHDRVGAFLTLTGLGVLARAGTNMDYRRLLGVNPARESFRVKKAIRVQSPVERVFDFWSNFANFPKFMTEVKQVQLRPGNRSHWVIAGPAGAPVSFDALTTRIIPNELIAWRSAFGSPIRHGGRVRFFQEEPGVTTIDLEFDYTPPGGALGELAARFFGANPKNRLDESLAQFKTLLESGPSMRQLKHSRQGR